MVSFLKSLVLPPASLFLLALAGLLLARRRPRLARGLMGGSAILLYLLSTPLLSTQLLRGLEHPEPFDPTARPLRAQAIIVLGADHQPRSPEYRVGESLGPMSLERIRYGAHLQRVTGLPLAVTGGIPRYGSIPLAELMRGALEEELGVGVRWVESASANTFENARRTAPLLSADGIECELLVTHAWHMPRARSAFEANGLRVIPAPTVYESAPRWSPRELVPSGKALRKSAFACHEWLGRVWYRVRYGG